MLEACNSTTYVSREAVYPYNSPQFERFLVNTGPIPVEIGLYISPQVFFDAETTIVRNIARANTVCAPSNT